MIVWSEPLNISKSSDNNWALQAKITVLDIQGRVNCTSLKEQQNYCSTLHVNNLQKLYHNASRILQLQITYYKKAMFLCDVHTNAGQLNAM